MKDRSKYRISILILHQQQQQQQQQQTETKLVVVKSGLVGDIISDEGHT
jgi:hypothetical protein